MAAHILDFPVWSSLTAGWSALAEGDAHALRLQPDHGPFAASASGAPADRAALAALIPDGGAIWLVEPAIFSSQPGMKIMRNATLNQMVAPSINPQPHDLPIEPLGETDAAEMLALAHLTVPGPFMPRTHRLGSFIGIKSKGKLVAMAGERMRPTGYVEVSGVCTHPDHRGRGYAGALMVEVARRILDQGKLPFLHTYASNAGAIALYEKLGFVLRAPLEVTILERDG